MNLKHLIFLVIFSISAFTLSAQSIKFFSGTIEEAQIEAKKQHKLIYILVNMGGDNAYVTMGQLHPEVAELHNRYFINLYKNIPVGETANGYYSQYNISRYPVHLYLDNSGGLLLKTIGNNSEKDEYVKNIEKSMQLAKEKTITNYKDEYKKGNKDLKFMKSFLLKYEELDLQVDQDLLDEYVGCLPISLTDDYQTVLFIMEKGPIIGSKAYKFTRFNAKLVDSIYKTLPLEKRVKMNNRLISYSLAEAKRTKSESLAISIANFASLSWTNNWKNARNAYTSNLMNYYKAVNDSTKYLMHAFNYYQGYYSRLRDSIQIPEPIKDRPFIPLRTPAKRKADSLKIDSLRKEVVKNNNKGAIKRVVHISSSLSGDFKLDPESKKRMEAMSFATYLNNGAYSFYTMRTKNPVYLSNAVIWVRRSIELFPDNAAYYDTLSHLYYQQQKYDEAIATQQKAINITKAIRKKAEEMRAKYSYTDPVSDYQTKQLTMYIDELNKMKAKTL